MKQVNIHQAKTQLSQLIAEVEAGEVVVIARAGKPAVRLVVETPEPKVYRKAGAWKGRVSYAPDYDDAAADAEILAMFEESINAPLFPDEKT
ncbi:MAG: type toxin-antitoxin system prevent-host-death family antitoxin [Caulobacter sp.]|nr:type toxin-antitoxin system prevent-host-death family antitoxin [Caulobacter sp.]